MNEDTSAAHDSIDRAYGLAHTAQLAIDRGDIASATTLVGEAWEATHEARRAVDGLSSSGDV